ncbi:M1 family peptidase [Georgenia subflava]|uniref:Aminopeptidase N n=1 Tax=Georgenia subflava TaxID=1622177 RepID=A0A6N7ECH0_9MICO|nr:M1 family peptidase [Georgenia subflava]
MSPSASPSGSHARRLTVAVASVAVATAGLTAVPAVASETAVGSPGEARATGRAHGSDDHGRRGHPRFSAGAPGAGDPYLPFAGNGGIDVRHYDLDLRYTPPTAEPAPLEGHLDATATIRLRATANLDQFNLDLRGLEPSAVWVDGKRARFTHADLNDQQPGPDELVITPRPKLRKGERVTVTITYGGTTGRPTDLEGALYGWVTTRDGAMVANEPDGAATWFPANDHPTDKATFDVDLTVPQGYVGVSNGVLERRQTRRGWTTWSWHAPDQMASYLATASVGNYEMRTSTAGPDDVPVLDFVDPDLDPVNAATTETTLGLTDEMMDFFTGLYGDYPFVAYGSIVDDDSIGYALETQTRSIFSRVAREGTAAHELAHSWVGNAVSPYRWSDIWLNEGWATYSTHLWTEHRGGPSAQAQFDELMTIPADDPFWTTVVADPGPLGLFAGAVYDRGAATLHALRGEIGDEAFRALAREWVERYDDRTASTADFEALAEEISGQDLTQFFTVWLHTPTKPVEW